MAQRLAGLLASILLQDGHQLARHAGPNLVDRPNVFVGVGHDFCQEGVMPLVAKRRPSREEEIERATQGVHVRPGVRVTRV